MKGTDNMLHLVWEDCEEKVHDVAMPMRDWMRDWWGERVMVPANDDPVYLAQMDGETFFEGDELVPEVDAEVIFRYAFLLWRALMPALLAYRKNRTRAAKDMPTLLVETLSGGEGDELRAREITSWLYDWFEERPLAAQDGYIMRAELGGRELALDTQERLDFASVLAKACLAWDTLPDFLESARMA